jgi:hypothetical protein
MFGVFDMLFGCWHKNYSFPITAKKGSAPHCEAERVTGTYVVCLDCGKEFPYDWNKMRVVSTASGGDETAPLAAETANSLVKVA